MVRQVDSVHKDKILKALRYGICDSYGKPRETVAEPIPENTNPRLHKVWLASDINELLQHWDTIGIEPTARNSPTLSPTALDLAWRAWNVRQQAFDQRLVQMTAAKEEYMKKVIKIEECIRENNQPKKTAMADLRQRREAAFQAKAAVDFPDTPFADIKALRCYKTTMRVRNEPTRDVKFEGSWKRLKPKIEKELAGGSASNSITSSSASTPYSTPAPTDFTPSSSQEPVSPPSDPPAGEISSNTNASQSGIQTANEAQASGTESHDSSSDDISESTYTAQTANQAQTSDTQSQNLSSEDVASVTGDISESTYIAQSQQVSFGDNFGAQPYHHRYEDWIPPQ